MNTRIALALIAVSMGSHLQARETGLAACPTMTLAVTQLRTELDTALAGAQTALTAITKPDHAMYARFVITHLGNARDAAAASASFAAMSENGGAGQVHGFSFATISTQLAHAQHWAGILAAYDKTPQAYRSMRKLTQLRINNVELDRTALECYTAP